MPHKPDYPDIEINSDSEIDTATRVKIVTALAAEPADVQTALACPGCR
jgi:hypothetical protein